MKVTDIASQISNEYKIENKKAGPDRREEQKINEPIGDKVQISSQSGDVQKMKDMVQAAPRERTELVQALKEQIDSGEYRVDSRELAGDMLIDLLKEQDGIADNS